MKLGADVIAAVRAPAPRQHRSGLHLLFARSKGAYAGLNLEGSVLDVRDSLNKVYYGQEVRPVDILVKRAVSNPGAKGLLDDLQKASK
jgi:lipid-binding SYLF domain-containing protein